MINFKQYCLYSCAMALVVPGTVLASEDGATLLDIHLIHHNKLVSLMPEPASDISSVRVAGVYWLPDFLKSNLGRTSESGGDSSKDPERSCEAYGYSTSCGENEIWDGEPYPAGKKCYKNCHCDGAVYKYDSSNCKASEGKLVSGKACRGKYEACVCRDAVTVNANTEDCKLTCGGKCVEKACKPAISYSSATEVCNYTCGGNCVSKSCKPTVSYNSASETCTASCGGNCVAKTCKPEVSYNSSSEVCTASCGGKCVAKSCKPAVTVGNGYQCKTTCGSSCIETECKSTAGYQSCDCGGSGGSVYSCGKTYYKNCNSCDPCPGYYACGGTWQYCTGRTCSADSSRCSVSCVSDYFPNSCSDSSYCDGVYRNGYCSGSCDVPSSGGCARIIRGDGSNLGRNAESYECHTGYYFCCDAMSHPICNTHAAPCTTFSNECSSRGGSFNFVSNVYYGGSYSGYSMHFCTAENMGNMY